jgi:hypothetical protein
MTPPALEPPEKERPAATPDSEPIRKSASTTQHDHQVDASAAARQELTDRDKPSRGQWMLESFRRRHQAAKRLPPLDHSGQRDPLSPRERADGWDRP